MCSVLECGVILALTFQAINIITSIHNFATGNVGVPREIGIEDNYVIEHRFIKAENRDSYPP